MKYELIRNCFKKLIVMGNMHEKNYKKIQSLGHLCGLRVYYMINK